jgi:hypothetical protein
MNSNSISFNCGIGIHQKIQFLKGLDFDENDQFFREKAVKPNRNDIILNSSFGKLKMGHSHHMD